jgi:SAM-dependent methyltransferase
MMVGPLAFIFACPRCGALLEPSAPDVLCCPADGLRFVCEGQVWNMLLPERQPIFSQFSREYSAIRQAEGRGSCSPEYYRALPYRDLSGSRPGDWRIRAASFDALLQQVVLPLERNLRRSLCLLDLGAGNSWLSNRLAQRGHSAAAVDLLNNDFDGLGCVTFYEANFIPVQAEFDHLPFSDRSIDLAVFNASLHYSPDFAVTLGEARRILLPGGKIVVMDTPVYRDASSGAQMVQERQEQFKRQYGFPSNALPSENYLTYRRLERLSADLDLCCQILTPAYPLAWRLRPLRAHLLGQREPAKFHLIILTTEK